MSKKIVIAIPSGAAYAIVGVSESGHESGSLIGGGFEFATAVVVTDLDPIPVRDLHALSTHGPDAVPAEAIGLPLVGVRVEGPAVSAVATPAAVERWRAVLGV